MGSPVPLHGGLNALVMHRAVPKGWVQLRLMLQGALPSLSAQARLSGGPGGGRVCHGPSVPQAGTLMRIT